MKIMPPRSEEDMSCLDLSSDDVAAQEMVFSLPLLCHQGRPATLDHMSHRSLMAFVTFMFRHAFVADKAMTMAVQRVAQIWPDGLPTEDGYSDALLKCEPERLRGLVRGCYRAFGCQLLLPLSAALDQHSQRGWLRLRRNGDGTVSLCQRATDRPVVTCRADNLEYDRPSSSGSAETIPQLTHDSYPDNRRECPSCGAHFVTLAASMAHERLCDALGVIETGSECESIVSEPVRADVTQPRFLGYLGLRPAAADRTEPYQSAGHGRPQQHQRWHQPLSWSLLLSRIVRTDVSSPLGLRLLASAGRQPSAEPSRPDSGDRADRHCRSRQTRMSDATFPVTWVAPPRRWRLYHRPHMYCFTARQRAERAAVIRSGLTARSRALLRRVRPCSVRLRRLSASSAPAPGRRPCWRDPTSPVVVLRRLTEADIRAAQSGAERPATPPAKSAACPADHNSNHLPPPRRRRHHRVSGILRDECKTIRDERFFRLLDSKERVLRARDADRPAYRDGDGTPSPEPGRTRSCGGSGGSGSASGEEWRPRRRISLMETLRGRPRSKSLSSDLCLLSRPADRARRGSTGSVGWQPRPSPEPAGPAWSGPGDSTPLSAGGSAEYALKKLLGDECKTLRGDGFVLLLNRPARTTRSAAGLLVQQQPGRRRRPVSVWLHWPGFAREPDHQTPVKHGRAAGQLPRRLPVVRLERLFSALAPAVKLERAASDGRRLEDTVKTERPVTTPPPPPSPAPGSEGSDCRPVVVLERVDWTAAGGGPDAARRRRLGLQTPPSAGRQAAQTVADVRGVRSVPVSRRRPAAAGGEQEERVYRRRRASAPDSGDTPTRAPAGQDGWEGLWRRRPAREAGSGDCEAAATTRCRRRLWTGQARPQTPDCGGDTPQTRDRETKRGELLSEREAVHGEPLSRSDRSSAERAAEMPGGSSGRRLDSQFLNGVAASVATKRCFEEDVTPAVVVKSTPAKSRRVEKVFPKPRSLMTLSDRACMAQAEHLGVSRNRKRRQRKSAVKAKYVWRQ